MPSDYYINIILVCLGTCPGVPIHIYPHMSKMKLVIEN